VAGTRNQAQVAAQLRLRRQLDQHDRLLAAFYRADAAVARAQRKIEAIRNDYEERLRTAEAAHHDAVQARRDVLAAVALGLGDERAADVLELPVSRVRAARRSVGADRARRAVSNAPRRSDGRDRGERFHLDSANDKPGRAGGTAAPTGRPVSESTSGADGPIEIGVA